MIVQPVLIAIPEKEGLSGPQKVSRQREHARRALNHCAELCGLTGAEWQQDANRVPQPDRGHHWSISHKPKWAGAVISDQSVGIDIEHLRPRGNTGLWDRLADAREWEVAGRRDWKMFFRLWTAKEATLKASGRGIGSLDQCRIVALRDERQTHLTFQGKDWRVLHHYFSDHVAAVTSTDGIVDWQVFCQRSQK